MTVVQLRTSAEEPAVGNDLLLDWFEDDRPASTINAHPEFLAGVSVAPIARELFALAAAVYCADKRVARADAEDGWTRTFEFVVAVDDLDRWSAATRDLERMLTFLSGDHVSLRISQRPATDRQATAGQLTMDGDAVCLFSGGLDSLTGAIDLLTAGKQLALVGHHDRASDENRQADLFDRLEARFGAQTVTRRSLYLRPALPNGDRQAQPLDDSVTETTTRTRSFLFITAAVAIASGIRPGVPVVMPENGFIGINVPLTLSRAGSFSTRTTHPLFVHYFRRVLATLGLDHPIENPFRLQTKGELIEQCADEPLLRTLAPLSVSCSHAEAARWHRGQQGNCGNCYPCLIRRAAMHRVGWDNADDYDRDALTDPRFLRRDWSSGASLRALARSLSRPTKRNDVLVNGRIPDGETDAFYNLWLRGRNELRAWLDSGASPQLRRRY